MNYVYFKDEILKYIYFRNTDNLIALYSGTTTTTTTSAPTTTTTTTSAPTTTTTTTSAPTTTTTTTSGSTLYDSYGYLYKWYTVDDSRELSSSNDWVVPSSGDSMTLVNYINDNYNISPNNFGVGNHLKSCRQINSPLGGSCDTTNHPRFDEHGTNYGRNSVNFNFIPGGNRSVTGNFDLLGQYSTIWTTNEDANPLAALTFTTQYDVSWAGIGYGSEKKIGYSIRLVREATTSELLLDDGEFVSNYIGNDSKSYNAVKIGTQIWTENLKETEYRNNDIIPLLQDITDWSNASYGARCVYVI